MTRRTTEIAIQFKQVPFALFRDTPVDTAHPECPDAAASSPMRASRCNSAPRSRGRRSELGGGADGFPLSRLFPHRAEHRLRDPGLRLHDRRRDAVPARRQRRGRLGASCSRFSICGGTTRTSRSNSTPPARPARTPRTSCYGAAAASGGRSADIDDPPGDCRAVDPLGRFRAARRGGARRGRGWRRLDPCRRDGRPLRAESRRSARWSSRRCAG